MKSITLSLILSLFCINFINAQTTVTFNCDRDNTLYESSSGALSNGSGFHFFAGRVDQSSNDLRRGLIRFDLSSIPTDAVIISCNLSLTVNDVVNNNTTIISLHTVEKDWGEAASNAIVDEVAGAPSLSGDATWAQNIKGSSNWSNLGGDFETDASASNGIEGPGSYSWVGAAMIADVQNWVNDPSTNFGWIVIGDEATARNAKRFTSRENNATASQLSITYSQPSSLRENTAKEVQIFPNPVKKHLTIKINDLEIEDLTISDVQGKVYQLPFQISNRQYIINTNALTKGVYFVQLRMKKGLLTRRFVK